MNKIKKYLFGALITFFVFGCSSRSQWSNLQPLTSLPKSAKIEQPVCVALVLGGGGARGAAHLGVLEALEEANIPIDLIVGSSIGGFIGSLYADQPNSALLKKKLEKVKRKHLTYYNPVIIRNGLWGFKSMSKFLNSNLQAKTFKELQIPLKVVATNLLDGEEVVLSGGEITPSVCASCAVPFYFQPVSIYGRLLVDGGVIDPVPIKVARQSNPRIVIAVDISGTASSKRPKNMIQATKLSFQIANIQHSANSAMDADIVIKPYIDSSVSLFNHKEYEALYQSGKKAAQKALPEIERKLLEIKLSSNK
ncbi:MAG: putative NTE family protein [Chlamydiae bacterium]|nr:putative NTE family protein [Chlamydiota bacterium]